MQNTSATYNTAYASDLRSFEVKLNIAGTDYGADAIFSLSTDSKIFADAPTIGGAYSATCEFSIISDGTSIPRMAKCIPYFRVTDGTNTSEWIKKGEFYIDTRKVTNNGGGFDVFEAFCYDGMMMANQPYSASGISWPATDTAVVADICTALGWTQDSRNAAILTGGYSLPAPVNSLATYRDYLSYIAAMYAANWIMSDDGKLRLVPIAGGADTLAVGSSATSVENSATRPAYTKVIMTTDEDGSGFVSGLTDTSVMEVYCPPATQTICDSVLTILSAWQYKPFIAEGVWSNPAVEVGDLVTAGDSTSSIIISRVISFGAGMVMELSAPNDQDVDHEYYYEDPEERRYRSTIADIKNEITMNGDGITLLSQTVENGMRNLILNTQAPSVLNVINLQGKNTYYQNYTPSVAEHGMRFTKGSSSSSAVLFAFGETSNTSVDASMCGLEAGKTYTLAFDWSYLLFAASSTPTYMRWRLLSWDGTTNAATLTMTEFIREAITRNTAKSGIGVVGTFTVPADAVVLCVYMDFITSSGGTDTVIANSAVRSTDYYEFANIKLEKGLNATEWSPAPEDLVGNDEIISKINIAPGSVTIDADKINLNGAITANNNVEIRMDGTIKAVNADLSGKFTMTDGTINVTTGSGSDNIISLNSTQLHSLIRAGSMIMSEDSVSPTPQATLEAAGITLKKTSSSSAFDAIGIDAINGITLMDESGNNAKFTKDASGNGQINLYRSGDKPLLDITESGMTFMNSAGTVTASYNADRANNLVTKTGTSVSLASATSGMANLTSFTLTRGLWIVSCIARFASNSTGYRYVLIATSATGGTQINDTAAIIVSPANGNTTRVPLVTAINVTAASATYYLNARQNSGSALASYGYVTAVKVS